MDFKINRKMKYDNFSDKNEAMKAIQRIDSERAAYYNYFSQSVKWGEKEGYDLMIDTSKYGVDAAIAIIKEYAKKGSCVIIGRCSDYVLRDEENILRLFIYSDLDHRQERVALRHPEIKKSQIIDVINKTDKRRSTYYNFYTGNKWGKYDNYDIAINSSTFGIEGTAEVLATLAKKLMEE